MITDLLNVCDGSTKLWTWSKVANLREANIEVFYSTGIGFFAMHLQVFVDDATLSICIVLQNLCDLVKTFLV